MKYCFYKKMETNGNIYSENKIDPRIEPCSTPLLKIDNE